MGQAAGSNNWREAEYPPGFYSIVLNQALWKDDYLKWICGFANASGGRIYVGVRDDGTVVGIPNSKKLLEDIPNKIRDTMGIVADVNLLEKDGKKYIEILVNPSSYPVSYQGEYHYRRNST